MEADILCYSCKWGARKGEMRQCSCPLLNRNKLEQYTQPSIAVVTERCNYRESV